MDIRGWSSQVNTSLSVDRAFESMTSIATKYFFNVRADISLLAKMLLTRGTLTYDYCYSLPTHKQQSKHLLNCGIYVASGYKLFRQAPERPAAKIFFNYNRKFREVTLHVFPVIIQLLNCKYVSGP